MKQRNKIGICKPVKDQYNTLLKRKVIKSSIVNEVIRVIISLLLFFYFFFYKKILQAKKLLIKSTQADICLICLEKVFYLLVCFFKAFKRKKAIVQKYLDES